MCSKLSEVFVDRLAAAVTRLRSPVVMGLDPRWQQLPANLLSPSELSIPARARAYERFCNGVIDVVCSLVPAVKLQAAFFEELGPDGMSHFLGNYDEMLDKKREMEEEALEAAALRSSSTSKKSTAPEAAPSSSSYEAEKQAKREERNRQRKAEQLESEIAQLEEQITALEERLADPEVFGNYLRVQELQAEIDTKRSALAAAYEQWEQYM